MRVGLAQIWQEVNTYSARPTGLDEFEQMELAGGEQILERHRGTRSVLAGFLDHPSIECFPLFSAAAWPAGPPDADTAEELLSRLTDALGAAGPLDAVFLNLHGAMVAAGHPDMELDVVMAVREAIGQAPIGCVLDLHGIPSPEFIEEVDVAVAYDTYPHVDMFERGREVAALMYAAQQAGARLHSRVAKLPMLTTPLAQASAEEPMRSLSADAKGLVCRRGLARISLLPGFPYSDVERAGFSVVGVADRSMSAELADVVDEVADAVEGKADAFELSRPDPEQAVAQALASTSSPVVIADIADNVGGGGSGDGTALLAELLAQGADGAIFTLSDHEVASLASLEGPGAELSVELGGKMDDRHGHPIELDVKVVAVTDGRYVSRGSYLTGQSFSTGTTAHLRVEGVDLVVTERCVPPFHAEQVTQVGLDPSCARVITAKGAVAWRSAFGDIAAEVIEADTPGVTPLHPEVLERWTEPMRCAAKGN